MLESGIGEDTQLPVGYRCVTAIVLSPYTPLHDAITAAGAHHNSQRNSAYFSFSDAMMVFARHLMMKVVWKPGTFLLSENEVYHCLCHGTDPGSWFGAHQGSHTGEDF